MGVELALHSVARGTSLGYATGLRSLESFARKDDPVARMPFPPSVVVAWIGFCAGEGLLWSTVKKYMSGIGQSHLDQRHDDPCADRVVRKSLKGLRNIQGGYGATRRRFCVTRKMLLGVYEGGANVSTHMKRLLKAFAILGFYGLVRNSELLDRGPAVGNVVVVMTDGTEHILTALVEGGDEALERALASCLCIKIYLASSKTDATKRGVWVVINREAAPVLLDFVLRHPLKRSLSVAGARLLTDEAGRPLSSASAIPAWSRLLLANGHVKTLGELHGVGISFRSGGATRLFELGTEDSVIRMLGRWKTDCFLRYVRETTTSLSAHTVRM